MIESTPLSRNLNEIVKKTLNRCFMLVNSISSRPVMTNSHTNSRTNSVDEKTQKFALPIISQNGKCNVLGTDGGLFSGIATLVGCVGAGIICPASLFWAAAPCAEFTMVALANPLLP